MSPNGCFYFFQTFMVFDVKFHYILKEEVEKETRLMKRSEYGNMGFMRERERKRERALN